MLVIFLLFLLFFFRHFLGPYSLFFTVWKKIYKSFNFGPISNLKPPNCSAEHQEHTEMSKKNFWIHQIRWWEPPRWRYGRRKWRKKKSKKMTIPLVFHFFVPKLDLYYSHCSYCMIWQYQPHPVQYLEHRPPPGPPPKLFPRFHPTKWRRLFSDSVYWRNRPNYLRQHAIIPIS